MAHRGERRLDGIAGTDVNPMLGRKVIERKQCLSILGQALGRFGVLRLIGGDKAIERIAFI